MLDRWPKVLHYLDQPHGDASFMPTLRVSELAAKHVKVVLTGDGGDELFAGYDKYAAFFARPGADALDDDAAVGEYTIHVEQDGRVAVESFRVEEYRVPTFAVAG